MNFVLIVPLLLTVLRSTGKILVTAQTRATCDQCPPGSHLDVHECKCKKCGPDEYMDSYNRLNRCLRCHTRENYEVVKTPCNSTHNTVFECKKGYYMREDKTCKQCGCKHCDKHDADYAERCKKCNSKECQRDSACMSECDKTSLLHLTTPRTTLTGPSTTTDSGVTKDPINPGFSVKHMLTVILVVVVVTFLVLFGFLLLPRTKNLKLPLYEQRCHQGSSPTTLSFAITEGTPMMTLSPPDHPSSVPICPRLPGAEPTVNRQEEHFPPSVLYAIINVVPPRRWKEFLRLLSVSDHQMERVEMEAGFSLGSKERQYQMLRLWSMGSSASMEDVFSALRDMDLSGLAQKLQESLDKLKWRPVVSSLSQHMGVRQDT